MIPCLLPQEIFVIGGDLNAELCKEVGTQIFCLLGVDVLAVQRQRLFSHGPLEKLHRLPASR
jgi:hypothetical protein